MALGFGRRKDDEPPSPFGGNTRGVRVAPSSPDPFAPRPGKVASAPGPDGRVVGRPRVVAVVGWVLMVSIGLGGLLDGRTVAVIFGAVWTLGLGALLIILLRTRVVVDGHQLHLRGPRGWETPVDLSRLRSATVLTGQDFARWVLLVDLDGHRLRIDAVNLRLKPLYRELARFIGPWEEIADERLERKIGRYR
jgi:hypothetical protein